MIKLLINFCSSFVCKENLFEKVFNNKSFPCLVSSFKQVIEKEKAQATSHE